MTRISSFDKIILIFNTKSTGNAKAKADELYLKLVKIYGKKSVQLRQTNHAGHAREIAFDIVKSPYKNILIISVSGDGGYHEVINGVVQAQKADSENTIVVAVEAAGNANDHYRHIRNNDTLLDAIKKHDIKPLELIEVECRRGKSSKSYYAHSYCGFGLTPKAVDQLNKEELNPVKEKVIVAKELMNFEPIKVSISGEKIYISNIIIAKVGRMSKVLKLHKHESAPPKGKLRLLIDTKRTRSSIVRKIIKAVTRGLDADSKLVDSFSCVVLENTMMQLDGEVYYLQTGDKISVSVSKKKLLTL